MLLNGVNHVAILTHDTDRLVAFYREVFDAEIGAHLEEFDAAPGPRLALTRARNRVTLALVRDLPRCVRDLSGELRSSRGTRGPGRNRRGGYVARLARSRRSS